MDLFDYPLDGITLIEASAGTGKTWTLCGVYLRLLLERGFRVEEILVVTFTNAAAAELRERIRGHIVATLAGLQRDDIYDGDPFVVRLVATVLANTGKTRTEMRSILESARYAFDEAAIFTIHGFCQRVLAETPFASALPYGLEVIKDGDEALRLAVVRDFWRRRVAGGELSLPLVDYLIARGDSPESWERLLARQLSRPLSKTLWPTEMEKTPSPDSSALQSAFDDARVLWSPRGKMGGPTRTLLENIRALNGTVYRVASVQSAALAWESYLAGDDPLARIDEGEGKLHLFCSSEIQARLKKNNSLPSHPFFAAANRLFDARKAAMTNLRWARLRLLRDMLAQSLDTLREEKLRARVVSFDDMLANVHRALTSGDCPWLGSALRGRYPVALIDEFQDTDPLQFAIFEAIYRAAPNNPGPLFVVGDPKQAIYSFRNADLHTYLYARERTHHRHTLRHNQRSVAPLIAALNKLFGANPQAFLLPDLAYVPVAPGSKRRKVLVDNTGLRSAGVLRVWTLPTHDGQYLSRAEAEERAVQATAAEVARLVVAGQAGQITLDGKGLTPGQIAILVRSHRQGQRIRDALAKRRVGSVDLSQESIFRTQDAEELERILQALSVPDQVSPLYAALATEMMGYNASALVRLRENEAALTEIMTRFEAYHQVWLRQGCGFMLRRWLDGEQVIARLLRRGDGERRLTNLLHLIELLQQATTENPSPEALLRWFAEAKREEKGEMSQLRLESDQNLVQIVTIHRAKGLEYDFVFCPFLWDGFRFHAPATEGVGYHDDQNQWVIDFRPSSSKDEEIKRRRSLEADAESLRLFYVALTRAVQRGYLVAGSYFREYKKNKSFAESRRSLLNWLVAGGGRQYPEWLKNNLSQAEIAAAWQALAGNDLVQEELPGGRGPSVRAVAEDPAALSVPVPPATIPRGWQMGSFSSLQRTSQWHGRAASLLAASHANELAASDHDGSSATAARQRARVPPPGLAADDFLLFPRGAAAGDCVHALFERIDFTSPQTWEEAIPLVLAAHPLALAANHPVPPGSNHEVLLQGMLRRLVVGVMGATLPTGVVLGRLSKAERLLELGFSFPAAGLDAATLNAWLHHHGYSLGRELGFAHWQGYLKGFIDLVFRHQGRFYLLDWKSNHLGFTASDYGPQALAEAMNEHDYHLQYLLYSVALQRYLGYRLPEYHFEQHFGGIFYLFVRGVRPDWQGQEGAPMPGVYFHRPEQAVLASLDALLATGKVGR